MKMKKMFLKGFAKNYDYQCITKNPEGFGERFIALVTNMQTTSKIEVTQATKIVGEGTFWKLKTVEGKTYELEEERTEVPRILVNAMVHEIEDNPSDDIRVVMGIDERLVNYVSKRIEEGARFVAIGMPWKQGMSRSRRRNFKKCLHTSWIKNMWCEDGEEGKEYFIATINGSFYKLLP